MNMTIIMMLLLLIVSSDAYQHIAASEGNEECVMVLLKHACNIHLKGDHHVFS